MWANWEVPWARPCLKVGPECPENVQATGEQETSLEHRAVPTPHPTKSPPLPTPAALGGKSLSLPRPAPAFDMVTGEGKEECQRQKGQECLLLTHTCKHPWVRLGPEIHAFSIPFRFPT